MKYLILTITNVLLTLHYAQARPEQLQPQPHHPPMISQHETVLHMTSSNATETNTSQEATTDSSESVEDTNITVQAKTAPMCPPRQPEIEEIERECSIEDKLKQQDCIPAATMTTTTEKYEMEIVDLTTEIPTTDMEETTMAAMEETTMAAITTEATITETTVKHVRKQCKPTCTYPMCILRRLDVLDSSDLPDRVLVASWIANNVTDTIQSEMMQKKVDECFDNIQYIYDTFEDVTYLSTGTPVTKKKMKRCTAAKKLLDCLTKFTECPVLKI